MPHLPRGIPAKSELLRPESFTEFADRAGMQESHVVWGGGREGGAYEHV